jgi:hypothetical protein
MNMNMNMNMNQASTSSLDLFDEEFKFNEEINHVNYNLADNHQTGLLYLNESMNTIASASASSSSGQDYPSLLEAQTYSSGSLLSPTVLHQTCLLFPQNTSMVRTAILGCPQAAITPSSVSLNDYTYPLHIALSRGASLAVIQQLLHAGPAVLLQRDGPLGLTPLALALTQDCTSIEVFQLLIQAQPHAAALACGPHYDLPLHTACRQMATLTRLAAIEALIPANTAALHQPNGQGLTPFELVMASQPLSLVNQQIKFRVLACLKYATHMTRPTTSSSNATSSAGGTTGSYKRRRTSLSSFL